MNDLLIKIYCMGCSAKQKVVDLFKKENGETNIIAIVLLIVIVIALTVIFRQQITTLINSIWAKIFKDAQDSKGIS